MEQQAVQPIQNQDNDYITSRGMRHAGDETRNRYIQDRMVQARMAQRQKAEEAWKRRYEGMKNHTYNPPRPYMTTDITDQEALNLYYQMAYNGKPLVKAHQPRGQEPLS